MSNLVVVPSEVSGWDVIHADDSQALTNHPTKESAIEAARLRAEEEGEEVVVDEDHVHSIDSTTRGSRTYFMVLIGALILATIVIAVTSLLASATGI